MSRVANNPVSLPKGVELTISGSSVSVKGGKGTMEMTLTDGIGINVDGEVAQVTYDFDTNRAMAGTTRALLNNLVVGVSAGWEKKLVLNGVGYRAKASGQTVNLNVGLSHPVDYELPKGLSAETPTQTEIVIRGIADEYVRRKEAKKK
jgi:large subunit ribosomal protein L6